MLCLKALAGRRYRVTLDESAGLDGSTAERPWYVRIPCRAGHIYVHSRTRLGACCDRRGVIPHLLAVDGVELHQRGDREASVTFPPDRLDAVAEVLKARRRRQVSEAERERLRSISRLPTLRGT